MCVYPLCLLWAYRWQTEEAEAACGKAEAARATRAGGWQGDPHWQKEAAAEGLGALFG